MRSDELLQNIASAISEIIDNFYSTHMGFALIVFPFDDTGVASNYISNGERKDMIKALRETADRIELNQVIGITEGEA